MTEPSSSCVEFKETIDGKVRSYTCEMMRYSQSQVILRYVLPEEVMVERVVLPIATVTYAFYWPDKPFTLYKWYDPHGQKLADYFNIADRVKIGEHAVRWRDLVVDLLCLPDSTVKILDEDEIPPQLNKKLLRKIMNAKKILVGKLNQVTFNCHST